MDTFAPSGATLGSGINHGDAFLMRWDSIFQWDPDTREIADLSPAFGFGYYTTKEDYCMMGNKFCRRTYGEEEPVILLACNAFLFHLQQRSYGDPRSFVKAYDRH